MTARDGSGERSETDRLEHAAAAVDLISKKWHPIIVQLLLEESQLRFSELRNRIDGISDKVLSNALDDLEEKNLVERRVISESPLRVEYALTVRGRDMQTAIDALADWGETHLGEQTDPKILVVDDDRRIADMHAGWLDATYEVDTAYDGRDALKKLDEDVSLVLLDRRMPDLSGEKVLDQVRSHNLDAFVVLVTSTEPDFDVVDMQIDGYIIKPTSEQEIQQTVEELLAREDADEQIHEYFSLAARRAILHSQKSRDELGDNKRYAQLLARLEVLRDRIGEVSAEEFDRPGVAEFP